jgi:DHA3 family macrolide efflux protein-like MFS transporter
MISTNDSNARGDEPLKNRSFFTIWVGQLISVLGSGMTNFALIIWVYGRTGKVTDLALLSLFLALPGLLIAPFAGALVDRWDRRKVMLASNLGSGLCILAIAVLLITHQLAVWHVYVIIGFAAVFTAFQTSAYTASISLLVPKSELGRANGMVQTSQGLAQLVSPLLGGILVTTLGVQGVTIIDFVTFLFAAGTLLLVAIPQPIVSAIGAQAKGSLFKEAAFGLSYIRTRPGLLGLTLLSVAVNFFQGFVAVLAAPYILAFSTPAVFGIVSSVAGSGMLAGAILLSVWGGPKRRIHGILGPLLLSGSSLVLVGVFGSPWVFATAGFVFFLCLPLMAGSSQAIWQNKVEPDIQGRVFAIRLMAASSALPLAYLCAGPLADRVFEPMMAPGGALAGSLGRLIGIGHGHGIGLLFICVGISLSLVALTAHLNSQIRNVEDDLPDALPDIPLVQVMGVAVPAK